VDVAVAIVIAVAIVVALDAARAAPRRPSTPRPDEVTTTQKIIHVDLDRRP
jgi:hypothetical protein